MELTKKVLSQELIEFNKKLKNYLSSKINFLDYIMRFLIKKKGKQIRPTLVLLSSKLNQNVNENSYIAAACVEILHTATLLHDDVVDNSLERRGFFSINALFKNKISVLAGDYLLSKGMLLALESKNYYILEILSNAIKKMSEAELLQLEKARNFSATEEIYYEIIKGKTASLLGASCALGVDFNNIEYEKKVAQMNNIGINIGIAFQIKDDILDYGTDWIGKPIAQDLKDKKLTLPLICAFKNSTSAEKKHILNIIKTKTKDNNKINEVVLFCKNKGGLKLAEIKMNEFKQLALNELYNFPKNITRDAFEEMINFMINRKK